MALPTITPLPTAPSRSDPPATFITRADAFVAALGGFSTEMQAFGAAVVVQGTTLNFNSTSTTSLTIGTGSKSLTVETFKAYSIGSTVMIASSASPANYMVGQVTAYSTVTGALTVNVTSTAGSGTFASWNTSATMAGNAVLTTGDQIMSGGLGIGVASALAKLDVAGSSSRVRWDLTTTAAIETTSNPAANAYLARVFDAATYDFRVSGTSRLAVDASGNTAITGTNSKTRWDVSTTTVSEVTTNPAGAAYLARAFDALSFDFKLSGSSFFKLDSGGAYPTGDNTTPAGKASNRYSVVYAGTGTINTSDERTKRDIGAIPDAWLDAWADAAWRRYKFNEAVQIKGDAARWHIGLTAQSVRDTFTAHDLDALTIGLLCYDEWEDETEPVFESIEIPAVIDADGNETEPARTDQIDTGETRLTLAAGDRWGLRYDECQAMEAAYQRRRMDRIEARIAALEAAAWL
jgi:hypothetical protein